MERIRTYKSLAELPPSYKKIFTEAATTHGFFYSYAWFNNLISTSFSSNDTLRIIALEEDTHEQQPYLALLMCYTKNQGALLSPRILTSATNYYSSLFGILSPNNPNQLESHLNVLANAIVNDQCCWDIVDLHPLSTTDPNYRQMQRALSQAGMIVQRYFCFGNWYLEVKGQSYQAYFNHLPSRLKNTILRKSKQLSASNSLKLTIISNPEELDDAIETFVKIYHASWKTPEPHPDFIPGLIRISAEQGWLRLGIAYIDHQPVAAQIWFVSNQVASIYKLAYDKLYAHTSVGTVLTAYIMQHVIDIDHVQEVDYLTGDDDYKKDWMSNRRERWGIIAYNSRTFWGIFSAIRHIVGRFLKGKWHATLP
jgi:hypothetical protein